MPCALAISAAVWGAISPRLFTPSVSRMMTFDLASLAQAVYRRGQSVADGRAVLDQSAADACQQRLERSLIRRQRALCEGFAREGYQSDAVAVTVRDERSGHLLGRRDAVGAEVPCQHRTRNVDGQHDVDALGVRARKTLDVLRARQRHDQQGQRRQPQYERQMPQPVAYGLRRAHDPFDARNLDRRAALQRTPHVVGDHRHERRQQPQIIW